MITQYDNSPDGICGNDDCGQISAWYVFSALGLYPVNPASGIYVIGSPMVQKATIPLDPIILQGWRVYHHGTRRQQAELLHPVCDPERKEIGSSLDHLTTKSPAVGPSYSRWASCLKIMVLQELAPRLNYYFAVA